MKKLKEVRIVLIIIITLVCLGGIIYFTSEQEENIILTYPQAIETGNYTNCKYINNTQERNLCNVQLGTCDNDYCFMEKSMILVDSTYCNFIENESLSLECSNSIDNNFMVQKAIVENNVSLCENVENRGNCYDNFYLQKAQSNGDKGYCQNINNEVLKNECFN